ncbi:MAG: hypothetical protein I3273_07490 [Candidatus Moeniiplasma glomeromycotorum]|nr:hypothetical protein [Candidatus Moeniiplasma glomeromycotorum]MCE8168441.1 hypothetical protein [Candidatus Moeniiplasma glomeromycotorum]MCE8169930.1 hypothetical protein [Candidatus Moeniiplasma glomeromycotorum]
MTELIIIKTNNGKEVRKFLEEKNIDYEIRSIPERQIYQTERKKISEKELARAYQEAWSNPQRYQEAQKWEKAAVGDWTERTKKDKK